MNTKDKWNIVRKVVGYVYKDNWKNIVGAVAVALIVVTGMTVVGRTAISDLAGLAVAQTPTLWKNVKDAAVGDALTEGILASGLELYNGVSFDRARGTIANGLAVDVTRLPGGAQTPADGFANPTTFQGGWSLIGWFNGSTWDRWRGQTVPVQGQNLFNSNNSSAANTALTTTITGVAGQRVHIYKVTAACTGGASTTATIADGAGVIWSTTVPANNMTVTESWTPGLTISTGANAVIVVNACGAGNTSFSLIQADQF